MPKSDRKRRSQEREIKLHFLGATKMVTGSLHLFEVTEGEKTTRFFIDAGLNQESHGANFQNRLPSGMKPGDLDFGIFTHAHIDHTGYFPRLVKDGFNGFVYTSAATRDLVGLLLPDSGHLQEEEAERANARNARRAASIETGASVAGEPGAGDNSAKKAQTAGKKSGRSAAAKAGKGTAAAKNAQGAKTEPKLVKPLYTQEDAEQALMRVKTVEFDVPLEVAPGIVLRFTPAGHLLGAAVVTVELGSGSKKRRIVFSGDLGRPNMPVIQELAPVALADYVICEGTYGNRVHDSRDRLKALEDTVSAALQRAKRGSAAKKDSVAKKNAGAGVVVMAAFAVGRVQTLLHDLRILMDSGRLPDTPVFVDGRMANSATQIHREHSDLYNPVASRRLAESNGRDLFATPRFKEIRDWSESLFLDNPASEPAIIISSSGMAAGGRILRHLENRLPHAQNTILFCGYQSQGTLGRQLVTPGVEHVRINNKDVAIRAKVEHMPDYSGHADRDDIIRWLRGFRTKPQKIFLVHGEEESLEALKETIEQQLRWTVEIPQNRDCAEIE